MAVKAYEETGRRMENAGYIPLREIKDPDESSVLTFWAGVPGVVIQQTWIDTGDVQLYRSVTDAEAAQMLAEKKAS